MVCERDVAADVRGLCGLPYGEPFDCGTLAIAVMQAFGADVPTDPDGMDETDIAEELARAYVRLPGDARAGDLLVFRIPVLGEGRTQHHLGVMIDPALGEFIHALVGRGVELHSLNSTWWRRHLVGAYRPAGGVDG